MMVEACMYIVSQGLAHVSGKNEYYNYYATKQLEYEFVLKCLVLDSPASRPHIRPKHLSHRNQHALVLCQ